METILDATWTAERVMKTYPQTVKVFLELRTDCVGCMLVRFCSLEEVATSYQLPLDDFLQKLRNTVKIPNK